MAKRETAEEKQARLARALRENMKKRKAQARGRRAAEASSGAEPVEDAAEPAPRGSDAGE